VAELGQPGALDAPDGAEVVDADGLIAVPAFIDPHVHLRTPGREDEEDIDSGTRAAAAGGFCAILAMPNTDPVVDTAPILQSLRERARVEARIPTGFLAAITRGQAGEDLTEMWELAEAGAAAFTDDGWFRTGDLAERRAENYPITGRSKDIINRGGVKFNPVDVEALLDAHPKILQSAIVPMPDPVLGEKACAFVTLKPGAAEPSLAELCEYLLAREIAKNKLPEKLVVLPEMPLTPTRKIIKGRLRAP